MKKLLLILFLGITGLGNIKAQTGLYAGLDFGFNSIWIANQNNYGYTELVYERTFGVMGGALIGYRLSETAGVQLGLNYVRMGQNYFDVAKDFGPLDSSTHKQAKVDTYRYIKLNYIHIPIQFRYQTMREKKEKINFHFAGGPVVGILLTADQYYEADTSQTKNLVILDGDTIPEGMIPEFRENGGREPDKEYFSGLDIGFALSAGVDIYLTDLIYFAPSINIYYGLTDLNSKPTREIPDYKGASHNFYGGIGIALVVNLGEE